MIRLPIHRLTPTAALPRRAEPGSVGYDLHADLGSEGEHLTVYGGCSVLVPTGIALAIPPGCYGRVAPRSGMAVRHGIDVLAGVVDPSYRGEMRVLLLNTGDAEFVIRHGDRVAQLIIERCETPEVEEVDSLDATARGAAGFGSTGR